MHEDYDDDDDDQEYPEDKYKHYFKFDPEAWDAWGKMLYDTLNDIVEVSHNTWYIYGSSAQKFPVNSWNPNTDENKSSQYLGSNYQGQPIWKKKYFISQPIQQMYKNHIATHAYHFINQPHYYKGMFDILN